ncbi:MAG: tetratricopeptide repeat protein [Myxococcota bacterium]
MDVTCERCGTEYEFDETLLSARGTSVKCTNCGHVFKVYPTSHDDADRSTSTWRLQHRDGSTETLKSLRELQRRIASGELTPQDQIARGDEPWKTLGAIPELETFFQAAQAQAPTAPSPSPYPPPAAGVAESKTPSSHPPRRRPRQPTLLGVVPVPPPQPTGPSPTPRASEAEHVEPPTTLQDEPGTNGSIPEPSVDETLLAPDESARLPEKSDPPGVVIVPSEDSLRLPEQTVDPQPTAESPLEPPYPSSSEANDDIAEAEFEEAPRVRGRSTPPPAYFDDDEDIPELPGRGWSPMRWLLIVTAVVAIGVIGANFDRVLSLFGAETETEDASNAVGDADAAMRRDRLAEYERAVELYRSALDDDEENPDLFDKLSNAHAMASQAIDDGEKPSAGQPSERDHAKSALHYAEQSLMLDPESVTARIAEADGLRLTGETKRARESLERARLMPFSRTAEFYRVDALLVNDETNGKRAGLTSAKQAVDAAPEGSRYRFLLARAALVSGDTVGAREQVEAVLATDADHPTALALMTEIEAAEAEPEAPPADSEVADVEAADAEPVDGSVEPAETALEDGAEATKAPAPGTTAKAEQEAREPAPKAPEKVAADAPSVVETEAKEAPRPKPRGTPPARRDKASASAERKRPKYDEYDRLAEAAGSDAFVDGRPPIRDFGWYMREGEASLAGGDYSRSRALFESALEVRPGSGDATDALGRVAYASGDYDLAVRYFRSAAQRGHPDGYFSLGEAYEKLGRGEEAVSAYYTYLKRRPSGRHVPEARASIKRIEPRVKLPEPETPEPSEAPEPPPPSNPEATPP